MRPRPISRSLEGIKAVINDPDVVAAAEDVLKAAFGDKFRPSPPGTASEDYSEFAGAGVPSMLFNIGVYDQERIDAARKGGSADTGQSFAAVRAGAEADHRNRHHRDDARGAQCLRSEGPAEMSEGGSAGVAKAVSDLILRSRESGVSKDEWHRPGHMVRDGAQARLLTMRVAQRRFP